MTEPDRNELLSAYFDGELPPEERNHVERLLDASPELRRDLDELGALAGLLRGLPAEPAPAELAPAVRRRLEREHLLPAAAGVRKTRLPSWAKMVSGLVASAAALLLMVYLLAPSEADKPAARLAEAERRSADHGKTEINDRDLARTSADRAEVAAHHPRADGADLRFGRAEIGRSSSDEAEGAAPPMLADAGSRRSPSPASMLGETSSQATGRTARDETGIEKLESPAVAALAAPAKMTSRRALPAEEINLFDVLPYFETTGDRVAVVEVTVIDVRKAVGAMQLLLARNAVPDASENGDAPAPPPTGDATAKAPELMVLYVETSESQLASTLERLNQDGVFIDLKLQPPVALEEVEIAEAETSLGVAAAGGELTRARNLSDAVLSTRGRRYGATPSMRSSDGDAVPPRAAQSDRPASRKQSSGTARLMAAPAPNARSTPAADAPAVALQQERSEAMPAEVEPETVATKDSEAPSAESFQLLVNVPAGTMKTAGTKTAGTDGTPQGEPAVDENGDGQAGSRRVPEARVVRQFGPPRKADKSPAPLRVLFVFQGKSDG